MLLAATAAAAENASLAERIDAALQRAGGYLAQQQDDDGAWRSETYGAFRDGPTLTPYVMSCLLFLPQADPRASTAYRRGVVYLTGFVGKDGKLAIAERELTFPVYTAASASRVIGRAEKSESNRCAQLAWLAYLRRRQLDESLGWQPSDPQYGGWGFSIGLPRKPSESQWPEPFCESNLAATIFGIAALKSGKVPGDDPAYRKALAFVERCQNFGDTRFDDGGFFFMPGDPGQNKAGVAGTDRFGRRRFHSYGTMTADGLRALLRCGLDEDHPRVAAARGWLLKNFSAKANPGAFSADRAVLQNATYYYWVWASSHAFMALRQGRIETSAGTIAWPNELAEELLRRQRSDGTWINRFTDAKEDDPLVATPWAASALAICRATLTGRRPQLGR